MGTFSIRARDIRSTTRCQAVSVVASSCTIAGILTTTAFILGPKDGYQLIQNYHGASGAIVTANGNLITPRFHEHLVQHR